MVSLRHRRDQDIYHVPSLCCRSSSGTDIKNVVGSDGFETGRGVGQGPPRKGVWVEYLWPHPVTLKEVPKVGYAVRRDGMLFASGYYVQVEDPAAYTKAYVHNRPSSTTRPNGLDAHHRPLQQRRRALTASGTLTMADEDNVVRVAVLAPHLIGTDLKELGASRIRKIGQGDGRLPQRRDSGVSFVFPPTPGLRRPCTLMCWAVRHDGLLFTSRYSTTTGQTFPIRPRAMDRHGR